MRSYWLCPICLLVVLLEAPTGCGEAGTGGSGAGPTSTATTTGAGGQQSTASSSSSASGTGGGQATLPWTRHFGGPGDDFPARFAVGSHDEIALLTKFGTSIDLGTGTFVSPDSSLAIGKLDANGATVWSHAFKGLSSASPSFVRFAPDGSVVVGATDSNDSGTDSPDFGGGPLAICGRTSYLAKLDANGAYVSGKPLNDCSGSVVLSDGSFDAAGNLIIVGSFWGTVDFGNGPFTTPDSEVEMDGFVVKLDPAGSAIWSRQLSGGNTQQALAVTVDASDDVLVIGGFQQSLTIGSKTHMATGLLDGFLAKLDAGGALVWSSAFGVSGATGEVDMLGVTTDPTGNVIFTGIAHGTVDLGGGPSTGSGFVAKVGPNGDFVWNDFHGSAPSDVGLWPVAQSNGNVILTGVCNAPVDLGTGSLPCDANGDVVLAALGSDGKPLWSERDGDSNSQGANTGSGPVVDSHGNVVVLVEFQTDMPLDGRLGTTTYHSAGGFDLVLGKLAP